MLYFLTGFPFAAAVLVCLAGKYREKIRDWAACGAVCVEFAAALGCLILLVVSKMAWPVEGLSQPTESTVITSEDSSKAVILTELDMEGKKRQEESMLQEKSMLQEEFALLEEDMLQTARGSLSGTETVVSTGGLQRDTTPFTAIFFGQADGRWSVHLTELCGMGLSFTMDGFRSVYVLIAAFMWLVSTIFSIEYMRTYQNKNRYYFFLLVTLGATVGIFLSADLFTTFIFFELMSLASYVWVAQDEKAPSLRAAQTYLAVAVIGGLVMLMGLFLLWQGTGTLLITKLPETFAELSEGRKWVVGLCLLFGFGAKAGAFPMHIWLPKAHPVAPAPASALLSGILTKCGIFGILIISLWMFAETQAWGTLILTIGTVTMVLGAVLALFSINLKRTLACSSISQIGFILVGIGTAVLLGTENDLAVKGAFLHMVNHSLIKLVLFSVAGVVYMNIHRLDLNDIRGFGRKKPLLAAVFLIGAVSISGIPLGSGYISKTLIHEGLVEIMEGMSAGTLVEGAASVLGISGLSAGVATGFLHTVEWLFLISGGLTLAYMTKLFVAIFVEKNQEDVRQKQFESISTYWNRATALVLITAAGILLFLGLFPKNLMDEIAQIARSFFRHQEALHSIAYYSWENLKGALISITIGIVIYLVLVRKWMIVKNSYVNRWSDKWDLEDRVYRPLLACIILVCSVVFRFCDRLMDTLVLGLRKSVYRDSPLPQELEEGTIVTHMMGVIMDDGKEVLNHTVYKKHPLRVSFEHKLALLQSELSENNTIIARSLSFGLLLFCLGLLLTLLYMLF